MALRVTRRHLLTGLLGGLVSLLGWKVRKATPSTAAPPPDPVPQPSGTTTYFSSDSTRGFAQCPDSLQRTTTYTYESGRGLTWDDALCSRTTYTYAAGGTRNRTEYPDRPA